MLRLVIEDGEGTTHVVPLIRDEITIGRQEGNTIRLTERNVSRCHARLTKAGTEEAPTVFVEDLDSYNGVKVNGDRILGKCTLQPDDTIQIGDYFLALEEQQRAAALSEQETLVELEPEEPREPTSERLEDSQCARFIVVSSNLAGEVYDLRRRETLIGRTTTDENDVVINHRSISRNHVKVIWRDGAFTVIDLASANGILVNGSAMCTATLVNGDIIEMGHVKLRFSGPGDQYEFTMADVDDVVVPPRSGLVRIVLMTGIMAAVAIGAYVAVDNASQSDSGDSKKIAQPTPSQPPAVAPPIQKPDAKAQLPTLSPQQSANEVLALLEEGEKYLEQRKWDDAIGIFERILQTSPKNSLAMKRIARARQEMKHRSQLEALKGHIQAGRWVKAKATLTEFERTSTYFADASKHSVNIEKGMTSEVDEVYAQGRSALKSQRIDVVRTSIRQLNELARRGYPRATTKASDLKKAVELAQSQQRAKAEPSPPEEKVSPPQVKRRQVRFGPSKVVIKPRNKPKSPVVRKPKSKTYKTLLEEARQLAFGPKHKEPAVVAKVKKLLGEAIAQQPNRSDAYFRMCMVLKRSGQLRAALGYCRDAAKRANPAKRKQLEGFIKALEKQAGK